MTMTATDAQIDAFERGYRALTACEDALTDLAERLDADALTPANAKNECALAAYELKTARDDLTKAVGDHGERLTRGLSDRLDAARKTVSALTGRPRRRALLRLRRPHRPARAVLRPRSVPFEFFGRLTDSARDLRGTRRGKPCPHSRPRSVLFKFLRRLTFTGNGAKKRARARLPSI